MVQESLIHALKEEGIEEIAADGEFDHNHAHGHPNPPQQMMNTQQIPSPKSSKRLQTHTHLKTSNGGSV